MNVGRQAVRAVVVIFSMCLTGSITAPILAQGWGQWGGGERRVPQSSGQWGQWGGGRVPQSPTLPMPIPVPMPVVKPENLKIELVVTKRTIRCRECTVVEKLKEVYNNTNEPIPLSVGEVKTRSNSVNVNGGFDVRFINAGVGYDVGGTTEVRYGTEIMVPPAHTGIILGIDKYEKTDFQILQGGRVIAQGSGMELVNGKTNITGTGAHAYIIPPGGSNRRYPTGGVTPY